jgi:hypothetical protein
VAAAQDASATSTDAGGAPGASGAADTNGAIAANGVSGTNGASGVPAASGNSGVTAANGNSGVPAASGNSGVTTANGNNGATAASGVSDNGGADGASRARLGAPRTGIIGAGIVLAIVAGAIGWLTPLLIARVNRPPYLGQAASAVAKDMDCAQYKQAAQHDESVYRYHDQGNCVLDGTTVTITTFDKVADGDAFSAVMRAVIPVLHPTWVGATYAAGDGWNVADARNLTAKPAEVAVRRLGAGATHVIPSTKKS